MIPKHFLKKLSRTFFAGLVACLFVGAAHAACTSDEIDVLGDGTQCETAKFTVTTTNLNANDTIIFYLSAIGTFYVDCGTDGVLSQTYYSSGNTTSGKTVTRGNTNQTRYTCTYSTGGVKTINFGGVGTGYSTSTSSNDSAAITFYKYNTNPNTNDKVAGISGSLGALFPTIGDGSTSGSQPKFCTTFYNCTNMTGTIPGNLFSGISGAPAQGMFSETFVGCSGLTGSIPSGLFGNLSGAPAHAMFNNTFLGCSGLTGSIPSGLFGNLSGAPANGMFMQTFSGCSGLTGSIPSGLFGNISGTPAMQMFSGTFSGCSGLTGSIPGTLFSGISGAPAGSMFSGTFNGCSGLTGSIPDNLFSGISGAPANHMFSGTFSGCSGLTGSIPGTLFSGISGAPASWMFNGTFSSCSGLTGSIPGNLFSRISGAPAQGMFFGTFWGCSRLTGTVPKNLFAGISTATTAQSQMTQVFLDTNLVTICPDGYGQYITGFESYFSGKKACELCTETLPTNASWVAGTCNFICDAGYYTNNNACVLCPNALPAHATSWVAGTCNFNCDSGYHVDNGSCACNTFNVDPGYYLPAGGTYLNECEPGSFCPGLSNPVCADANNAQGITACSTLGDHSYTNSDTGASANTQCYKSCTVAVANIAHAATVAGKDYYGAGTDTCFPTSCENGYHVDGVYLGDAYGWYWSIGNDGSDWSDGDAAAHGLTQNGTFTAIYWGNNDDPNNDPEPTGASITGRSQCSTRAGAGHNNTWVDDGEEDVYQVLVANITDTLPDSSGTNCYCTVDSYTPDGGSSQSVSTPWVFLDDYSSWGDDASECASYCSDYCGWALSDSWYSILPFRTALGLSSPPACAGNIITVNWSDASAADIAANTAGTATYGGDIRTPRAATIIPGKVFLGWKFSAPAEPMD